ncbi:MAG: hypothetical protein OXU20_38085 [Myxococcales bacterium]|nr:hypothetical protein [Myxococcales bacterium]MDD9970088.1 hypothetical protein [Myxococcales bacterium]
MSTPGSPVTLDLHDIQGNIVKAYSRYDYSHARYVLFEITDGQAGRGFIATLAERVTTSAPWGRGSTEERPESTLNVALTFAGLRMLGLPQASLLTFSPEFATGMRGRGAILGDDGPSGPERWDPVWRKPHRIHVLITINGVSRDAIETAYAFVTDITGRYRAGVRCLTGHRDPEGRNDMPYQAASAIEIDGKPTPKEHFGYTDGIGNPYFKGTGEHPENVLGGGKVTRRDATTRAGWEPLETGEFLLGYKDEAQEFPEAPMPPLLGRNGTYMVYRKLHQNVGSFNRYLDAVGTEYPGGKEALAAKFAGRWRNGAPVTTFPTEAEAEAFAQQWMAAKLKIQQTPKGPAREEAKAAFAQLNAKFVAFDYSKDLPGAGCPVGAHIRRTNPRGSLEFGEAFAFDTRGALTNRRRILRRGLPYGSVVDPQDDTGEHGIVFMALGANIRRQFEFVQQQWVNYGNDFRLGNDRDPIIGNHGTTPEGKGDGRMTIEAEPGGGRPPFLCGGMPRFVETRGGEYFFVPSITALRLIGEGMVDPT